MCEAQPNRPIWFETEVAHEKTSGLHAVLRSEHKIWTWSLFGYITSFSLSFAQSIKTVRPNKQSRWQNFSDWLVHYSHYRQQIQTHIEFINRQQQKKAEWRRLHHCFHLHTMRSENVDQMNKKKAEKKTRSLGISLNPNRLFFCCHTSIYCIITMMMQQKNVTLSEQW